SWKPYRTAHKMSWKIDKNMPNRSIRERLERIRLINHSHLKSKRFPKHYFSVATYYDVDVLFSLPICETCLKDSDDIFFNRSSAIEDSLYRTSPQFIVAL
ncbi:MAG TPA: hypothetical protein VGK47_01890, partial [Nitrososphaeraceae archaeon]